ncbi:MAG: DNA-processing protein DprA [Firmicutes bacterium]|nr:DNA-processing protein DprA [Bacillota bacterium]
MYQFSPDVKELYYKGNILLADEPCIAVVGSRKCTTYGVTVAKEIGKRAAQNQVVIVSGLAKGIDTAGHQSVMAGGGNTIAVLGGGTDRYYPAENRQLQRRIASEGLLLSEHPSDYLPRAFDFPKRNRIISALSESVVVVEAPNRSGALITAEAAEEQGKQVYAVPGNITSHYSFGTNKLIREGAMPLILLDDLFVDMGICPAVSPDRIRKMGADEYAVYQVIAERGEITAEEISFGVEIPLGKVHGILTVLEMKGVIFSAMGKFFVANY